MSEELDQLWRVERPATTKIVSWAASLGDRSENADYQYNKKKLREIDRRVRYLNKCLEYLKVVYYSPQQDGRVFFGAWVEIENEVGESKRFRIVGYDEIFAVKNFISIDSPMARALLKKQVGDEVVVETEFESEFESVFESMFESEFERQVCIDLKIWIVFFEYNSCK